MKSGSEGDSKKVMRFESHLMISCFMLDRYASDLVVQGSRYSVELVELVNIVIISDCVSLVFMVVLDSKLSEKLVIDTTIG